MQVTYWLKFGEQYVGSVRAESGLSDDQVKRRALDSFDRVPLVNPGESSYSHKRKIQLARVLIFQDAK